MKKEDTTSSAVAGNPQPLFQKSKYDKMEGPNWKMFDVPMETFSKFESGRYKFERWSKYLNLQDEKQDQIYRYAKRQRKNTVVLRCEETGALRAIFRKGYMKK